MSRFKYKFFEHFAGSRPSNMKHRKEGRCDAPDPVLPAVVFETRLIAAELFLRRDRVHQFLVARVQRIGDHSSAELGQIASRNRHLQHVFHIRFDGGIAAMSSGLQPPDQRQQSRPEDWFVEDVSKVRHISFTVVRQINSQPMFGDKDRRLGELDELVCLEFVGGLQAWPLNVFVGNFIVACFIDAFRRQVCPQRLLLPPG